jgi:hypothetical protein
MTTVAVQAEQIFEPEVKIFGYLTFPLRANPEKSALRAYNIPLNRLKRLKQQSPID